MKKRDKTERRGVSECDGEEACRVKNKEVRKKDDMRAETTTANIRLQLML